MTRRDAWLILVPALLALGGCVSTYRALPGEATARIDLTRVMEPEICLDGEIYRLRKDRDGYSEIPAGRRLVLRSRYYSQGYPASYVCSPALGLQAQAGGRYLGNLELRNDRCHLEVFREDAQGNGGLAREASVDASARCVLRVMQD